MRTFALSVAFMGALVSQAFAWGQEGHSIIAEIAQVRLSTDAAKEVARLLKGRSLASVASWADDLRDNHPETTSWHFVDIPLTSDTYEAGRDCNKNDCVVAELDRLKMDVRCAPDVETTDDKTGEKRNPKIEALKFAVHFVGDIHQPLHDILEDQGGNLIEVDLFTHGLICTGSCFPTHAHMKFHAAWDIGLIEKTVWDWGAYVERLEAPDGWLNSTEARQKDIDGGTPRDWAIETHKAAQVVWDALPADYVLDDNYFKKALPIIDRQLGVAGLRLARFLNEAYGSAECPASAH
jgi:nuclease S1